MQQVISAEPVPRGVAQRELFELSFEISLDGEPSRYAPLLSGGGSLSTAQNMPTWRMASANCPKLTGLTT